MPVETFAIPVLMKAVDFLFGEAQKILQERREARQVDDTVPPPPEIPLLSQEKDTVLKRKVSDEMARQQSERIEGILKTIGIYQQNYQWVRDQVAMSGGLKFAPIHLRHQLLAQEEEILKLSQELAQILERLNQAAR